MFLKNGKRKWLNVVMISLLALMVIVFLPSFYIKAAKQSNSRLDAINSDQKGNPMPYRDLTTDEIVTEMGAGWNLGNTMDGHTGFTPNETIWQSVETSKELIQSVHNLGFNTVRVPVTWGNMINDENGYTIDEAWISRVQDIVDYCIEQDMYVIINVHHDGAEQTGWLRVTADDIDAVSEKFEGVWRNIAERFKDYDEHLIFESMNEVTGDDGSTAGAKRDTEVIMNLNQIFVNVVRSTGSNNSYRWLSVPGRYTNIDKMTDPAIGFDIPKDTIKNRLFVSVHYYDFTFGMAESLGRTVFSYDSAVELASSVARMKDRFTSKGIPVIMGEYGCVNKDNTVERAYHVETFTRICQLNGIVACYWDQGWYDRTLKPDYSFALVDRNTGKPIDSEMTDAIMRGTYLTAKSDDLSDIMKDVTVNSVTDFSVSEENVALSLGENKKLEITVTPSDSNDIILWKTMDESIATVFGGNIRARGIGKTTITAFSQSGSVEKVISVTVYAKEPKNTVTGILTEKEEYSLMNGKHLYLNACIVPSGDDNYISYKSSNEAVASVSVLGKVVAKSTGTAFITMTASSGITKTVKVIVKENDSSNSLTLALNVYFNDSKTDYYSNEVGENTVISGDGQYTLAFDIPTHLSSQAKAAGVTGLNNLTAVYIKDYDVTLGNTKKSPLVSCKIKYDKIVVDGVELTINQMEPKSAIKSSGVLDTNDPINSWDGSAVEEVTVTDHVLNILGVTNPLRIEVTFTISDLVFENSKAANIIEATNLETGTSEITLHKIGEEQDVSAIVTPSNAQSSISFISSDESVVYVDSRAVLPEGESGKAIRTLTALSNGTATITAITENGLTVTYQVTVNTAEEEMNTDKKDTDENVTNSDKVVETTDQVKNQDQKDPNTILMIVLVVIAVSIIGIATFIIGRRKAKK